MAGPCGGMFCFQGAEVDSRIRSLEPNSVFVHVKLRTLHGTIRARELCPVDTPRRLQWISSTVNEIQLQHF